MNSFDDVKGPLVVGLGEALFDCFGERVVLGGAPVNFACQMHQLLGAVDGASAIASRVGVDDLGLRLRDELQQRGLLLDALQNDTAHPTGTVQVTVDDAGHPEYEIKLGAAWDHMAFDECWSALARRCDAICFGTLAQRSPASRDAIERFLTTASQAIRLFDVNLRQDYWGEAVLRSGFGFATAVKLNDEELGKVCDLLGVDRSAGADNCINTLCKTFSLDSLALTRGERGTVLYQNGKRVKGAPISYPHQPNADAVGAGDACSAGLVAGFLLDWPAEMTVELANILGAFVASRPGATPMLDLAIIDRFTANVARTINSDEYK